MSIRFDHKLVQRDAASLGWSGTRLAAKAGIAQFTVSRFFRGAHIRPETAAKLAGALGQPIDRYLVTDIEAAS